MRKAIFNTIFCVTTCCLHVADLRAQQSITNRFDMQFIEIQPGSMIVGRFQPTVGKPPKKTTDTKNQLSPAVYQLAVSLATQDFMPGFKVNIPSAYYIGKYEVTQQQWRQVMGTNPSVFANEKNGMHPVENVGWEDVQAFIRKLNRLEKTYHYRLPTEFEWEYAARAGAQDDIPWTEIRKVAVLSGKETSRIGTMKPNAWGIYDMLGNVWEWVQDYYNEKIFADPFPAGKGKQHVLKGASFVGDVKNATYMTHAAGPGNGFDVGFRLVMEVK
jgi:formylglycine-generating enzyme